MINIKIQLFGESKVFLIIICTLLVLRGVEDHPPLLEVRGEEDHPPLLEVRGEEDHPSLLEVRGEEDHPSLLLPRPWILWSQPLLSWSSVFWQVCRAYIWFGEHWFTGWLGLVPQTGRRCRSSPSLPSIWDKFPYTSPSPTPSLMHR